MSKEKVIMKLGLGKKELKNIVAMSEEIALKAAKILIKSQKKISKLKVCSKDTQGVASEADFVSEALIIKELSKAFPEASLLAEEGAFSKYGSKSEAYLEFQYLSSPEILERMVSQNIDIIYNNLNFSQIYQNFDDFVNEEKKITKIITNEK